MLVRLFALSEAAYRNGKKEKEKEKGEGDGEGEGERRRRSSSSHLDLLYVILCSEVLKQD